MTRSFAALLSATILSAPAFAGTFTAETALRGVTLYAMGGADASRTGSVVLPAGDHQISIRGLPVRLADNPAFVRATLGSGVTLTDLRLRTEDETANPNARLQDLEARLDALRARMNGHEDTIRGIDVQLALLANGGSLGGDPKGWGSALKAAGEQTTRLIAERRTEEKAMADLRPRLDALQAELDRSGGAVRKSAEVTLTVHADKAVTVPVTLDYFLTDAYWRPKVESYLDSAGKSVAVHFVGELAQTTGEDWKGVAVDLAIQRPSGWFGSAELPPAYVGLYEPGRERAFATAAPMAEMRMAKGVMADAAALDITAFDRRYKLKDTVTLPSGGEERRFDLEVVTEKADLMVRSIPSRDTNAYVFADITWGGETQIDHAQARLVRDGNFVGEGQWPTLVPGEAVELPYGEDPLIDIDYVREAEKDKAGGFFKGKAGDESRTLITVKNNHDRATKVEIIDRVPVSTHEDVKVEIAADATPATARGGEDAPGIVKWKKTLKPGEVWTIRHAYRISYPDGKRISQTN